MIQIEPKTIRKKLPKFLKNKIVGLNDTELKYLINEVLIISLDFQCEYLENKTKAKRL